MNRLSDDQLAYLVSQIREAADGLGDSFISGMVIVTIGLIVHSVIKNS